MMQTRPTTPLPSADDTERSAAIRTIRYVLAALAVVVLAAAGPAGRVVAHAELLETIPADGQVVETPPVEVVLRFSEQVSLTGGSAAVLDDEADVVSGEARVVDESIVIALPPGLDDGTYTVTWQVISADSHRIAGASVFHVGAPSAGGGAVIDEGGDEVAWTIRFGASALTAVAYAGALIGVGGWWAALVLTGRPAGGRWRPLLIRAMVLGAAAIVAALPLRIARIGGGLDALRDDDFLAESLRGPLGVATAVTAIGLIVTALLAASRSRPATAWLASATGAVALAGFALEGHTRAQQPAAPMIALDIIHVGAAAFWLGGLAGLAVAFRSGAAPERVGRMVARFSAGAAVSVIVLAGAGAVMAWIVLPSWGDLFSTGYGLTLLTKVALVAVVVALGAFNNRRLVPAISAGAAASDQRRHLARIVRLEVAVLLAVVAVTAVLVARSPVSSTAATPPPATLPAEAVELPLSSGVGTVAYTIAPGRAGTNELRLAFTDPAGQPLELVEAPTVELTEAALGLGPLRPLVHPLDVGQYHVIAEIPIAGTWEMTIRARVSEFEAATATTQLTIAG